MHPTSRMFANGLLMLLLAVSLVGTAAAKKLADVTDPDVPRSLPDDGRVSVHWEDPAQFSEIRGSGNRSEAKRGDWVMKLATHLRTRAEKVLPPGERLDVVITDIRRAGNYEPWRGINFDTTRFMREIYWPRIALTFKRIGADGQAIEQGERTLSDASYLSSASGSDSDPLRYEKRMIDRWLQKELKSADGAGGQ